MQPGTSFETDVPQRLDRLPWSSWHTRVVAALGITWILDGLEVTIVGALGAALMKPTALGLRESEVGLAATAYLAGTVAGAIVFARLTDRGGRRRWFLVTLLLYLAATFATAFAWNLPSFLALRFLTGAGIGGEYAAINSAIDELIPARWRGQVDLGVNGSWWLGTLLGALATIPLLDPRLVPEALGWRICFALGALLGVAVLFVRRAVPESPRWLATRGRVAEAERIVAEIEAEVVRARGGAPLPAPAGRIRLRVRPHAGMGEVARELLRAWPRRTVLGLALMVTQSFLYNAVFFTYALVLARFYGVAPERVGLFLVPFAIGNFCGPLLLGRLFDTVGRRVMIASTYGVSAVLLALTGWLFAAGAPHGDDADAALDGGLLLRVGGRELGLPHGERDLPARDPRDRDRVLLRRGAGRGRRRAVGVRAADRGVGAERLPRLPRRCRHDGARRRRGLALRRRRGAPVARGRRGAARLALTREGSSSMLMTQM